MHGVVVGNEVLDAMPVQLLHFDGSRWFERGVALHEGALAWADRPPALRPPVEGPFVPGTVTEIHPQAEAFVRTWPSGCTRGAGLLHRLRLPRARVLPPAAHGGTLMCHRAHQADTDPLADVGEKDITAHVNFSGIALAAQDAGLDVLGYTSQARFLLNCGLPMLLKAPTCRARRRRS
jgi:SAM-dependent MidA family methyltransferase